MQDNDFQFERQQLDVLEQLAVPLPEYRGTPWRKVLLWIGGAIGGLVLLMVVGWNLQAERSLKITSTPAPVSTQADDPMATATPTVATVLSTTSPIYTPTPTTSIPTFTPTSTPTPLPTTTASTEELLAEAVLPERDQRLLAMRLKHHGQKIPQIVRETPYDFQLSDSDTFWVTDNQQTPPLQFEATAYVKYITDHAYWWVQEGFRIDEEDLKRSAERFENETYPTNRAFFGSEWSPGVDNDVHIHIFLGNVAGVAGYFSTSNEYSKLAETYSNEREMFFINLNAIRPGNDYFDGVLAHVFQYMIHWHQDRNEDSWVNAGLSELATFINGYGSSNFVGAYLATPDTQLTGWADSPNAVSANYGAGFLFMAYFLQRYGEEMTQAVVANPQNGIAGFNAVLAERGSAERFDDIFADFLVANYVQDPAAGAGQWGYTNLTPGSVTLIERYSVYPQNKQASVYQYGADYIELIGQDSVAIEFTGSTYVKVVDNEAHSGNYQWYSHRGDSINTHLTRAFDLSEVNAATLTYWTWYDIEENWDYGYVEISTDGGKTWTILQSSHTATDNPTGNAFGPGYTGSSDGGPTWIEESIDLSAYTGHKVLIRFEFITEESVNYPGWTIDDISIPEIGFFDNVENGSNGWQAEGFVRIDNILPQRFSVQVIEIGDEINVRSMPLNEVNTGTLTVADLGTKLDRAVLIISGLTPFTTQPASYEYSLTSTE